MANTRSQLEAAKIYSLVGGVSVDCMFNPYEYTISKTNRYQETPRNQYDAPRADFKQAGAQTLKLELFFDTYEAGSDVTLITNKLWKLMESKTSGQGSQTKKIPPPHVAFEWGVFRFEAVIISMDQKFTLFKNDGTPVRAKVNVSLTNYVDDKDFPPQNPTSGGGDIERAWRVVAGDRLDAISYQIYGNTANWKIIAEKNKIRDPLALRPGQILIIPALGE